MKILHVVGARPNFPKLAPVYRAARAEGICQSVVHTGQHYDEALSGGFFRDLDVPEPTLNLEVGSGSHAVQTARIMERIEPVLLAECPDWVVVYGDVNSTVAATLVAVKLGLRVAHVEAGLRSGDRSMPEEVNRIVTDSLADLLLTPSRGSSANLQREGVDSSKIAFVGNVMIDTLFYSLPAARAARKGSRPGSSDVLVTLHRPSNVDDRERLAVILTQLDEIARSRRVLFAAHPRAIANMAKFDLRPQAVEIVPPMPYLEMIAFMESCGAVVTDSGGVQEETTTLGTPCFTVRDSTERPITVDEGTNTLVRDLEDLPALVLGARRPLSAPRPEGWDGHAAQRIIASLRQRTNKPTIVNSVAAVGAR